MQIILLEKVPNLGQLGDVVKVRDGYARNFLLPRGLAALATADNVARQTGGVVLELPHQPGVRPGTDSYFGLMDSIVKSLADALGGAK